MNSSDSNVWPGFKAAAPYTELLAEGHNVMADFPNC